MARLRQRLTTAARAGATAALVATALSASPAAADGSLVCAPAAPGATGVMLVGDSVTHGSDGDWTWRYRLWRHLRASGAGVDLVGPRDDLHGGPTGATWTYADPDFDQDHAAQWGMSRVFLTPSISSLVEQCRPDVVVDTLGVNDLTWLQVDPESLVRIAAERVEQARAVRADVDVVLGQVPQHWFDGVAEYNALLHGLAAELSTPASRVVVAEAPAEFVRDVDTYDLAHASATGEVKIAAAVADALAELGVGSPYPRPLPAVANGPSRPATVQVVPGDGTARVSWTPPPGSTGETVWLRDTTAGTEWTEVPEVAGTSVTLSDLPRYHELELRTQSRKGTAVATDRYSDVVRFTPAPPPPARVAGLTVRPGPHRADVAWRPVATATAYEMTWRETGRSWTTRSVTVPGTGHRLDGLVAGRRYDVAVRAVTDRTPGPAVATPATASGPLVAGPRRVVVSRGATRVRLTWRPAAEATRYEVWRTHRGTTRLVATTSRTSLSLALPRGGTATFRVRAWHQDLPGGWSPRARVRGR